MSSAHMIAAADEALKSRESQINTSRLGVERSSKHDLSMEMEDGNKLSTKYKTAKSPFKAPS